MGDAHPDRPALPAECGRGALAAARASTAPLACTAGSGRTVARARVATRALGASVASAVLLAGLAGCGPTANGPAAAPPGPDVGARTLARAEQRLATCAGCHTAVVRSFLGHGMAHTLAPLERPPVGELADPASGDSYRFEQRDGQTLFHALRPDGGLRTQLVLGRYGAGVADTAFVGTELDRDGRPTGRLGFLPLESLRGHGLVLAPFEQAAPGTGLGMPFTGDCLTCHSTQDPAALPGAAHDAESGHVWPAEHLGADAFEHLRPLGCDACHGPVERHAELMLASLESGTPAPERGLARLGDLPAGRQRDVCARCHLQGEGHLELEPLPRGGPQPDDFLLRRPVLVPAAPGDDFRFVSQVQRLALSACFAGSPDLTCTSCHDPHAGVAAQGTAAFDARCLACHGPPAARAGSTGAPAPGPHADRVPCSRDGALGVADVTGRVARTRDGCVDCHVRRSQPFDLPGVATADHFVRRRIPRPASGPMREWEQPDGALAVFDDGRFAPLLASPAGRDWAAVVVALRLPSLGRVDEALAGLASFPPPGSEAATRPAVARLPPLRTVAVVHHLRGLLLEAAGDLDGARAAYGDALRLDPGHPQARLNRGALSLEAGDLPAGFADAAELLRRFPLAEKPWNLRARGAALAGELGNLTAALIASTAAWPSDAATWHALGQAFLRLGRPDDARLALEQARRLQPSRQGLADDLAAAGS